MEGVVQILLANAAIFFVVLLVLLLVSGRKKHKVKDKKQYLSKELLDIKEQISEDLD